MQCRRPIAHGSKLVAVLVFRRKVENFHSVQTPVGAAQVSFVPNENPPLRR